MHVSKFLPCRRFSTTQFSVGFSINKSMRSQNAKIGLSEQPIIKTSMIAAVLFLAEYINSNP